MLVCWSSDDDVFAHSVTRIPNRFALDEVLLLLTMLVVVVVGALPLVI